MHFNNMEGTNMKRALAISAFAFSMLVCVFALANKWGPYGCVGPCSVGFPNPDGDSMSGTLGALTRLDGVVQLGDLITVCNTEYCTEYEYTSNRDFLGIKKTPQSPPGPPPSPPPLRSNTGGPGGGGGGGGSGGGGGYNPPGGCYGSGCYEFDCKVGGHPCSMLPTGTPPVSNEQR